MIDLNNLPEKLKKILENKFGDRLQEIQIPPSAFITMEGQLIAYNLEEETLQTKFPVKNTFLNQFGNMNGGMIAAAIDNTYGPLSMLVAPPNFTRNLEVKYKKPIPLNVEYIYVNAQVIEYKKRQVILSAEVVDIDGCVYATSTATHWIIS